MKPVVLSPSQEPDLLLLSGKLELGGRFGALPGKQENGKVAE